MPLSNYWCRKPPVPLLPTSGFSRRLGDFVPKPEGNSTSFCRCGGREQLGVLGRYPHSLALSPLPSDWGAQEALHFGRKLGKDVRMLLNNGPATSDSTHLCLQGFSSLQWLQSSRTFCCVWERQLGTLGGLQTLTVILEVEQRQFEVLGLLPESCPRKAEWGWIFLDLKKAESGFGGLE